ncbi:MAG: FG-GAP-like repeat-containing protein [Saprospiraceae bacterium]|nr:FG-GAP-like repeat-containing protein [Saprospiraceae bacterium]
MVLVTALMSVFTTTGQDFIRMEGEVGLVQARNSNGVAVADYDNDGDLDIFLVGYHSFVPSEDSTWNRLFRNDGHGAFEDVTLESGFDRQFTNMDVPAARGEKMGASWGDFDNDGFADIFLTNSREDQLYHNNGDGTFTDVTMQAGVQGCHNCYSASGLWWDHDRDGDLDLYVSILNGENIMYENLGDGTFRDVTRQTGLAGAGITWTSVALDVGKDGFLDLYLANDTQINQFFENRSGLVYNEATRAYRLDDEGAGMGIAVGDYNNDGLFDIYVTNIFNHHPNPLFKNLGNRRFEDVAQAIGVENSGWGWGTHFFDCDLDGDEDLAAVNGVFDKQYIDGVEQQDVGNFFFRNMLIEDGTVGFIDWSEESGTDGDEPARGLEVFDYDMDGDLDMLVANVESTPYLFRNEAIGPNRDNDKNWIQIKLEGTISNRNAFGTEIKITIGESSYYRWYHGAGFFAQSIKPVHFGLGEADRVDKIEVTWPSGMVETIEGVNANQVIEIVEGSGLVTNIHETSEFIIYGKVFPNPFIDKTRFDFSFSQTGEAYLRIFSVYGQEVYREQRALDGSGSMQIDWGTSESTGSAPPGVYYYLLELNGQEISGKLSKL